MAFPQLYRLSFQSRSNSGDKLRSPEVDQASSASSCSAASPPVSCCCHSLRRVHDAHGTSGLPATVGLLLQDHESRSTNALHRTAWRLHVARCEVAPHVGPPIRHDLHLFVLRNIA